MHISMYESAKMCTLAAMAIYVGRRVYMVGLQYPGYTVFSLPIHTL
jgi:hypothetical protein